MRVVDKYLAMDEAVRITNMDLHIPRYARLFSSLIHSAKCRISGRPALVDHSRVSSKYQMMDELFLHYVFILIKFNDYFKG